MYYDIPFQNAGTLIHWQFRGIEYLHFIKRATATLKKKILHLYGGFSDLELKLKFACHEPLHLSLQ